MKLKLVWGMNVGNLCNEYQFINKEIWIEVQQGKVEFNRTTIKLNQLKEICNED